MSQLMWQGRSWTPRGDLGLVHRALHDAEVACVIDGDCFAAHDAIGFAIDCTTALTPDAHDWPEMTDLVSIWLALRSALVNRPRAETLHMILCATADRVVAVYERVQRAAADVRVLAEMQTAMTEGN